MVFAKNSQLFYDHLTSLVRVLEDDSEVEVVDFLAARLLGSGKTSNAKIIDDEALIRKRGAVTSDTKIIDDVALITKKDTVLCKPFLLRNLPPFFILNSLSFDHFTAVILAFFKKRKNTKRTTSVEIPLVTKPASKKSVNYNNLSLFYDVILLNRDIPNIPENEFEVTKEDIYKAFRKMPILKHVMGIRKLVLKIRDSIRSVKSAVKSFR
jgi:hypothetical protein